MSKSDSLGDRMKSQYEVRSRTFLPRRTNTIIRLDGKAFHTYTRGLARPYDLDFMSDMDETAKFLCENVQGCKMAYVQSDEISLLLVDYDDITTEAWFDGNVQKMTSISASMAAAKFNQLRLGRSMIPKIDEVRARHVEFGNKSDWAHLVLDINPLIYGTLAFFDSRVFTIPDPVEVHNYFVWRSQDATRNSIQMAAQSMFSHKEMHGINCNQLQEKMWSERGVNWNDYPEGFKRGRCVVKETYMADVPSSKSGRADYYVPKVERTRWTVEPAPIFSKDKEYCWKHISQK